MGLFSSRSSSDNSNLSDTDVQQLRADATANSDGTPDQRAQAANQAWAVNENERNKTAGR